PPTPPATLVPYTTLFRSTLDEVARSDDMDDTRSLSVLTAVADGDGRQATVVATSERVRVLDNGPLGVKVSPSDERQIADVSSQTDRKSTRLNSSHVSSSY